MAILRFEKDTHKYFLGDREIYSVTTILKMAGLVDDWYYTPELANFGNVGHQVIHLKLCGKFESVDERFNPWLRGVDKFIKEQDPQPYFGTWADCSEKIMCLDKKGFAGTPDAVGMIKRFKNNAAILDWKFWSTASKAVLRIAGLQTAGYEMMIREYYQIPYSKKVKRAIVHFFPEGYTIYELDNLTDQIIFQSAANIVQWKETYAK